MRGLVALVVLHLVAAEASAPGVHRWGTLREVLRDGRTQARVSVADLEAQHVFGLGALEGLGGELIVVDGRAWVSRPSPGGRTTTRRAEPSDRATFAVAAAVEGWTEHALDRDLTLGELEQELLRLRARARAGEEDTLPFVLEGRFADLEAHVLAGACALASPEPLPDHLAPRAVRRRSARGVIVGFLSGEPPGVISHHGSRLHAHVLLDGRRRLAGHLDAATVLSGSALRLPRRTEGAPAP